mmetsp:Transcript_6678/g.11016  ORF Transcript_6678/g.11016 Transcript_6678/m.11016 type:complete len:296 (-) Transcript_6678:58-945(-)|eukprot:CAMPEP_0119007194 /NCGR_PEP_ID=MMETSP1176-20130426/2836_1 /TAXON_ID=265551 /ORGANISM="Synedropsis recta cf, Strain CCMP1620" /LENGTH=295 /DNA_ID=CAMNT_0006959291 /DNA_START=80 /DNA_END=967 /DNA_ORIENTATION=+
MGNSSGLLLWFTASILLALATGFSVDNSRVFNKKDLEEQPPDFHSILDQVGKTVIRPGGTAGTKTLLGWSALTQKSRLLELSAGWGKTGMMFARKTGCQVVITDLDQNRLNKAKEQIEKQGMSDLMQTRVMDMFDIESSLGMDAHFDCALAEASLTNYSLQKKEKFFQAISNHADQYLLHEICFRSDVDETTQDAVRRDMRKILRIGWFPETVETWKRVLEDAGFDIQEMEVGDIEVLNPLSIVKDEGIWGAANIIRNVATHPDLRSRMLATRDAMKRHHSQMGYILLKATKRKS